jgi:hypothetical protein
LKSGDKNQGMANYIVTKGRDNASRKPPELIQTSGLAGGASNPVFGNSSGFNQNN